MKLFGSAASPFVRKVLVVAHELELINQIDHVITKGTPTRSDEDVILENPLGKVPCLICDDGTAIYDSRVITQYLNAQAQGTLYPSGDALWKALTLEATADGLLDAAVLMVYEKRVRPTRLVYKVWVEAQWEKVSRALDAIEMDWMADLKGEAAAPHYAVACALGYLDFRHAERDWRAGREDLAQWYDKIRQRASMVATQPA